MSRKIYVIGSSRSYANWMEGILVDKMEAADLVVLTGGEDINPFLYGEEKHPTTYFNPNRDAKEVSEYYKAKALKIPVIGICRGLQLITALNGGKLVQDQSNPGTHEMFTFDNRVIVTTSAHHQAAFPFLLPKDDYKILGWTENLLNRHLGAKGELNPPVEVEMIYFPKTKSLGIQGHPEWLPKDHESIDYFRNLLNSFLDGSLESETKNLDLSFQKTTKLLLK